MSRLTLRWTRSGRSVRRETLYESKDGLLDLSEPQAQQLQEIGRRLASRKLWWGDEGDERAEERTAIACSRQGERHWRVRVANAVGVIGLSDLQLVIRPKIPTPHLLFLLAKSGQFPRLDELKAQAGSGEDLWPLVARWFVTALESVLRRDLVRDYELVTEDLRLIKGHVDAVAIASAVYRGTLEFTCEFDEFVVDTPLNRLLKAAARAVAASQTLAWDLRNRARALVDRLDPLSELRPSDFWAQVDRQTSHYVDAIVLARHILLGQGRVLEHGELLSRTFLIPTPLMVEEGLRTLLTEALAPRWDVRKKGITAQGADMSFNPDLLFGFGQAVGDVKYKLAPTTWNERRSDVNQILAFATAHRATNCCIVSFRETGTPLLPMTVGGTRVVELSWAADASVKPSEAARGLVDQAKSWLASCAE